MKAYSLHAVNDLRYEEVEIPELKSGWALVRVMATGICSSDIPRVFTKGTYHFPTIPGHEFSGIVEKVADTKNEYWVDKHVGVFPLIPCRSCDPCKEHHYEMCEHYDYIGSRRDGAFAEYVAAPIWNLLEIPDNIPFEHAAMLEPLSVALHAVKRSGIKEGDSVAVVGTGMIGFAAAQWAQMLGASSVTVIGRSNTKKSIAEKMTGVTYSFLEENKKEYPNFDVVIEAVGTPSCINEAINMTKAGGHLVFMGNPSGDIALSQNTYWRILRKQLTITGTWNSAYESGERCDWTDAIESITNHRVEVSSLITHVFDQNHVLDGMKLMLDHKEPYCKVMTTWNRGNL
jgi:L-iditol 2-dehydrogenase